MRQRVSLAVQTCCLQFPADVVKLSIYTLLHVPHHTLCIISYIKVINLTYTWLCNKKYKHTYRRKKSLRYQFSFALHPPAAEWGQWQWWTNTFRIFRAVKQHRKTQYFTWTQATARYTSCKYIQECVCMGMYVRL